MTGIIILNYQTWEHTFRCIESIYRTCSGLEYRIYLVDNASKRPMPGPVKRQTERLGTQGKLVFLQAEKNRGYAAGNNLGAAQALADGCSVLIIANSDIIFMEHAVQRLAECLNGHPEVGTAGPKIVNLKGEIQPGRCSMRTGISEIFQLYTAAKVLFRRKWKHYFCLDQDPHQGAYAYHVSGCCFAVTAECAAKILPFDENTVLYGEELILGIRMEQNGLRAWYEPGSTVVHAHGAAAKKVRPFMYQCISQSELYYCSRYLKARAWQLQLLFRYRRLLYRLRCIKDRQMRTYWKIFDAETKKAYLRAVNHPQKGAGMHDQKHNKKDDKKQYKKHKAVSYVLLPYKIVRRVNLRRIGYFFKYMREEGLEGTLKRFRACIFGTDIYRQKFNVCQAEEITSVEDCRRLVFPKTEHPEVSILIPACSEFSYTYRCLKSILSLKDQTGYEVILADGHSGGPAIQTAQAVQNIKVVRADQNLGFLKNCNYAAGLARGRYLLFLNPNTQVQEGWLDSLVKLLDSDEGIGLAGSKLLDQDLRILQAGGIIWKDGTASAYGNGQDAAAPEYNYVRNVDYVCGASMMIRTDLWKQIGGFDEGFTPAGCEDADLAFKVRKAGYRVVYQPLSAAVCLEGISRGTAARGGIKKYQAANCRKLYEKWKEELCFHYAPGTDLFQASERSFRKKTVLFLDQNVPAFDCDAGSKTVYAFLKVFLKHGWRVKFAGTSFYQREPYTTALQQMGIEVLYGDSCRRHFLEWLDQNGKYIDFVFLNRPDVSASYIDYFCSRTHIQTAYYGHDLHFLRCQREYALTKNRRKKAEASDWYKKEMHILRRAQVSYYPSEIEVRAVKKIDASIPVKTLTPYAFENIPGDISTDFEKRKGLLFVGGFTHRPNQDAVFWFVKEIYPHIWKKKKIPFYIAGSNMPKAVRQLNGKYGTVIKGQVSDEELKALYAQCRIAAVPLRYGAGIKGKVIEAAYYGLPCVTTSQGAEGIRGIENAAVIRDNAAAFAQEILRLYEDFDRLKELSAAAQALVKKSYSMDAVWETLKEDFC